MRCILLSLLLIAGSNVLAAPENDYMIHCMGCHLVDGTGMPPDIPAFDANLIRLVASSQGRAYLVQVPGASQAPLNDGELAGVLNWILEKYGNVEFNPYTAEEVRAYRSVTLANPAAVRASLVRK